jgi:hypothetical protein
MYSDEENLVEGRHILEECVDYEINRRRVKRNKKTAEIAPGAMG